MKYIGLKNSFFFNTNLWNISEEYLLISKMYLLISKNYQFVINQMLTDVADISRTSKIRVYRAWNLKACVFWMREGPMTYKLIRSAIF